MTTISHTSAYFAPVAARTAAQQITTTPRRAHRDRWRIMRTALTPARWALIVVWVLSLVVGHVVYAIGLAVLALVAAMTNQPSQVHSSASGERTAS